jgi:hypothetical protein
MRHTVLPAGTIPITCQAEKPRSMTRCLAAVTAGFIDAKCLSVHMFTVDACRLWPEREHDLKRMTQMENCNEPE